MSTANNKTIGVILMTYGSPETLDDVPAYLRRIYGGKDASKETITEFQRRYALIGGSPLVNITKGQAAALEKQLQKDTPELVWKVAAGMRFSKPFIAGVVSEFTEADEIIGIIMSPQYSPIIMQGYHKEIEAAVKNLSNKQMPLKLATDWHLQLYFLQAMAERVTEALNTFPQNIIDEVPVLFSAHSMPKRVIENEPDYINNLQETAAAIAEIAKLPKDRWMFCYQSAGHTPEEWLKPDFADIMPELQKQGKKHVLIAPVQFLADHLEILYDVGIGAKEQAEAHGIQFARTESLNTSPLFIKALSEIVKGMMVN